MKLIGRGDALELAAEVLRDQGSRGSARGLLQAVSRVKGGASLEEAELDGKVNFLIKVLKYIIAESGFELLARIELRDKRTGRCFR